MCGIAGIVRLRSHAGAPELEALRRMAAALRHRGPNEFGVYRDLHAGLAHTRLSIIDLATGQQPLCNEDETLWITFNGEVFNYLELRAELEALGHRFRTKSDTEVIVHAYEAWGDQAFARMNGQWAIALWDSRAQRLTLARDRVGVRPLYVCEHEGSLYFASEVKGIFAANASIPRALDPFGLDETLTFWSVLAPRTAFAGVEELRPGLVRVYDARGMRETRYWTPIYAERDGTHEHAGSIEHTAERVREALSEATTLRMLRADVPVGSYLSGGLDSSLVTALAAQVAPQRFHTFSLRFEDSEYDETGFQRLMARHLGTEHHEVLVRRGDIAQVFPEVIWHAERTVLRTAPAPLFLLSRLVRDHGIKVVLTGEGADEYFAGYDLFREGKVRRFWAKQPDSRLRPRALERLYPYLARSPFAQRAMAQKFFGANLARHAEPGFAHQMRWGGAAALKRLMSQDSRRQIGEHDAVGALLADLPAEFSRWPALAQDQYLEVRTLLSGYLLSSQGDRMLMAHSVEGRFPFLDRQVISLADTLPAAHKLRVLDEKHVLKRAAHAWVPKEIVARRKQPYRAPDAAAFVGETIPEYVEALLSDSAVRDSGLFDVRAVGQLWKKCKSRESEAQFSNADNMALVGVLSTQLLHHQFVRAFPRDLPPVETRTLVDRVSESESGG
jgi:asparagine synthase (glutamine-hydrolysing)